MGAAVRGRGLPLCQQTVYLLKFSKR